MNILETVDKIKIHSYIYLIFAVKPYLFPWLKILPNLFFGSTVEEVAQVSLDDWVALEKKEVTRTEHIFFCVCLLVKPHSNS
jgi:hypothetical protein